MSAAVSADGCGAPAGGAARPADVGNQAVVEGRVTRGGEAVPVGYARLLNEGGEFVARYSGPNAHPENTPDAMFRLAALYEERARGDSPDDLSSGLKQAIDLYKRVIRELEPGFAGLSFQVIRRNPRAYQLYREAASAFTASVTPDDQQRGKRRRARRGARRRPRSSYDPLQGLDKRDLVGRIRTLEQDLATERQQRSALAYDQQTLLARIVRLETEIVLLQAEGSHPE